MAVLIPQLQRGFFTQHLRDQAINDAAIRELMLQASQDAEARIAALAGKDGIGAKIRAAQLTATQRELQLLTSGLRGPLERTITQGLTRAAETGGASVDKIAEVLTRGLGDFPGLREGIIAQARAGIPNLISRGMNGIPLSRQVYRTTTLANGELDRLINSMIATGSSWRELAESVRKLISPTTPGGVSYAAKRLSRTELNNAFHTTQIRGTLKSPFVTGYIWNLSGSHTRPDQCNLYASQDQGHGPGIFTKGNVPGKPHPQCLCYITYETPTVDEFQRKFLEGDYDEYLNSVVENFAPHLKTRASTARKTIKTQMPKPVKNKPINNTRADRSGSHWDRLIHQETGEKNGIPFRNVGVQVGPRGGRGYVASQGRIYRVDGLDVLIEVPEGILPDGYAERKLQEILRMWRDLPAETRRWLRKVEWVEGRNPMDFEWAKRYKIEGFQSAASGGNGRMTFWNRSRFGGNPEGTFQHEFGHVVDGQRGLVSRTPEWRQAILDDAVANRQYRFGDYTGDRFEILPGNDKGNTTYGTSEVGEDFAEAVQLFLAARRNAGQIPFRFNRRMITYQEMFPNRYKILSKILGAM